MGAAATLLTACASDAPTSRGEVQGAEFQKSELIQSESNRLARGIMVANQQSLMQLADKLYRRNPAEWRKTATSREAALALVETAVVSGKNWDPLAGHRFAGDVVLAIGL